MNPDERGVEGGSVEDFSPDAFVGVVPRVLLYQTRHGLCDNTLSRALRNSATGFALAPVRRRCAGHLLPPPVSQSFSDQSSASFSYS